MHVHVYMNIYPLVYCRMHLTQFAMNHLGRFARLTVIVNVRHCCIRRPPSAPFVFVFIVVS